MQLTTKHPLPEVVDGEKVADARAGLPAEEVVQEAVEVFKMLSSSVRICILHALTHDELSVGDLARALDLSLSVASHQLALLRRMKLVAARGDGRVTFYRATNGFVGHLVHDCLAHVGESLGVPVQSHHHAHRLPAASAAQGRTPKAGTVASPRRRARS